jgi:hypothetical protein
MLWLPGYRALVLGDSLMNAGAIPDEWLGDATREEHNETLRPLLDLQIELLLPTRGDPATHAGGHLSRLLGGSARQ